MAVIQQVYFTKEGYSVYIKAIKPDEGNPESGLIWVNGNPTLFYIGSFICKSRRGF